MNRSLPIVLFVSATFATTCCADSLPRLDASPENGEQLWASYDARSETLDVEVVRQWKEDGLVLRYVVYSIGTFQGKKARMAAFYGFPEGGTNLPALMHLHGGGQRAFVNEVKRFATRSYAVLSVNWGGRPMEFAQAGDPNTDWGAVDPTQKNVGGYSNLLPKENTIDPFPSARNNNWFLLTVGSRRGTTFLQQQKEVDTARIGLFGHSMGGRLTGLVAGSDDRVKAESTAAGDTLAVQLKTDSWGGYTGRRPQTWTAQVQLDKAVRQRIQLGTAAFTNDSGKNLEDWSGITELIFRAGDKADHSSAKDLAPWRGELPSFFDLRWTGGEPIPKQPNADNPPANVKALRPVLQIINGSRQPVQVYWLKSDHERISNGKVPPGGQTFITTTLGHRFAIVGQQDKFEVTATSTVPVQAIRFDPPDKEGIPTFYTQRIRANGFPIVASAKVNPYALKEAAYLVNVMLSKRPDVRRAMIHSGARLCILAHNEFTTDQPEFAHLGERPAKQFPEISGKDYRDARARGMGGSERDPFCSCAEENLLGYPGDPYAAECILIHELAHNIHLRGMVNVDPTFDTRLKATYDAAMAANLWKGKYASVNRYEYFAEGVQSWFDDNRENDHDHNHVNTRKELVEYDPRLAEICREVFGDTNLRYTKPATRLEGHLQGYDPSIAPTFQWPKRLDHARAQIRRAARQRDQRKSGQ